ncbi:MAG: ferric reductase-like transmembrane domain-containing protein [Patescibacteria group bacterium]
MNLINPAELRLWSRSFYFSFLVFAFILLYSFAFYQDLHLLMLSKAVAGTAGFLIGCSLVLSSICYYFDVLDRKIGYRKYLGLLGFWYALLYAFMLLFLDTERYVSEFFDNLFTPDVILGISAMILLTFSAAISNKTMMMKIGPELWRKLLRLPYLAYALLILRAIMIERNDWIEWLVQMDTLPPPRLLLTLFAIMVIVLRTTIPIHKATHRKNASTSGSTVQARS